MRYNVIKYARTNGLDGFIDTVTTVYDSFIAAEKRLQYLYVSSQSLHSASINTTDKSAHVWRSLKQDNDFVIIVREDNPYFAIASLVSGFTWHQEPARRYWEPLFNMIRDYLAKTTDQPELFKDLNN